MEGQIRQGDILLVPVEGITPPASAMAKPEVILAEGEITGHAHRLSGAAVLDWMVGDNRYVQVTGVEPGTLRHEDHDPSPAPVVAPGVTFRVVPQTEWDLSGQWRRVVD